MALTQRQQLLKAVIGFCEAQGSRTFALDDFQKRVTPQLARDGNWSTQTPQATVRRLFQELRDKDEVISFVDNQGQYTLRGAILLSYEAEPSDYGEHGMEEAQRDLMRFVRKPRPKSEREEYVSETVRRRRDSGLIEWAKNHYGFDCMVRQCGNRFTKPDGKPYIEAHHITPLCDGGHDVEENIALVCAHHHRMAHFANKNTKTDIRDYLLKEVDNRLRA